MSVQKLIAEADKLLEKGKIPEALDKLKSALNAEPTNQLVATKLANVFVDKGDPASAAKVYIGLANRLSDAGKAQVAIAVYKQAMELTPGDYELKFRFAKECEGAGKLGDAHIYGQQVLQYYLQRKKYFDASNLMPILVRVHTKDETYKLAWVEIMQYSQAEQKLPHMLVALCGPPGLTSQEFSVGGDPSVMSDALYESIKRLVDWFPRDPKIAYSVSWCAYKRQKKADFFRYLAECLRRDADFCLGYLLLARWLAEQQKLNESLFVYKMVKEKVSADKSVDMLTLHRMIEAFVEKNGWITFTEGTGEVMEAKDFLGAFGTSPGEKSENPDAGQSAPAAVEQTGVVATTEAELPAEIELSLPETDSATEAPVEIQLSGGETRLIQGEEVSSSPSPSPKIEIASQAPAAPESSSPVSLSSEVPDSPPKQVEPAPVIAPFTPASGDSSSSGIESALAVADQASSTTSKQGDDTVEFTSIIKREDLDAEVEKKIQEELRSAIDDSASNAASTSSVKPTFNPLEAANQAQVAASAEPRVEKTEIFSPIDLLRATNLVPTPIQEPPTRSDLPAPPPKEGAETPENIVTGIEGERTVMFSPVEAVEAGVASRRPFERSSEPATPEPTGDATVVLNFSSSEEPPPPPQTQPDELGVSEPTMILSAPNPEGNQTADPVPEESRESEPMKLPGFVPIPEMSAKSEAATVPEAASEQENVDLGDDLLEGPTRLLVTPAPVDSTTNLIREVKGESSQKGDLDVSALLKKADRYVAKRNYYLARKALRHAQALGADEEMVKGRLREIRKLELPDSLYSAVSSDEGAKEKSDQILEKLEREFDLVDSAADLASDSVSAIFDERIENILEEADPRTALDFGVALHEMGLFKIAEKLLIALVERHPDSAFDAYYLAAVSKSARKDYAGAASILKRLSADAGKSEKQKIPIYYALGELFERMEQFERSKSFFRKVAEIDSNYRNIKEKLEE